MNYEVLVYDWTLLDLSSHEDKKPYGASVNKTVVFTTTNINEAQRVKRLIKGAYNQGLRAMARKTNENQDELNLKNSLFRDESKDVLVVTPRMQSENKLK